MLIGADDTVTALERVRLGSTDIDGGRREAFVQDLVHRFPSVIPMREIEPAYDPMISVCRELSTPAGYLDNLWITPDGGLILGECKLVKNPQARREVVAQALDYARALARWTYEDLERSVQLALAHPAITLWQMVERFTDLEQEQFVDAVERRLRAGRLMVLVIGDGIQEGVEALTDFLQMHAGIHAGLALVDLSIWRDADGRLLVIPRVPMRTVLVPRGIVTIDAAGSAQVVAPRPQVSTYVGPATIQTVSVSEIEFYDQLSQRRPELTPALKAFAMTLPDIGVAPDYRKSLVLRWSASPDVTGSAGYIDAYGTVWFGDACGSATRLGMPEAGERYLAMLATAIGGTIRRHEKSFPDILGPDGRTADIATMLAVQTLWRDAIAQLVADIAGTASA
jgi:hypothetical protein